MANRFQQFLLASAFLGATLAHADGVDGSVDIKPIVVVEPDSEQREAYEAQIDTEFFEIGAYVGILSIEDFTSSEVFGLKTSFHATEDFFLQANLGRAEAGISYAEEQAGDGVRFLAGDDRKYTYYNLLVGYNIFPGETFVTQSLAFNSAFYIVAGAGNTEFAGDKHFTLTYGSGYRIILKDWLTVNIDFRDHTFKSELSADKKRNHNLEFTTGITAFF